MESKKGRVRTREVCFNQRRPDAVYAISMGMEARPPTQTVVAGQWKRETYMADDNTYPHTYTHVCARIRPHT